MIICLSAVLCTDVRSIRSIRSAWKVKPNSPRRSSPNASRCPKRMAVFAAASKLADAEIARARGVAEANKIIGDSLKGNDAYLKYLWITDVAGTNNKPAVIYVPTEANMPILEAGRRS